jgi:hypothetical protein
MFLLDDGRIWIREVKKHLDPTDPDSQHWFNMKTAGFTGKFATKACQRLLLLNAVTAKVRLRFSWNRGLSGFDKRAGIRMIRITMPVFSVL